MFKLILISLSLMIVTGCSTSTKSEAPVISQKVKHKMFQTVSKKEAILVQKGKDKEYCCMCGMNLVKFYKTSHAAKEGKIEHQYCSLHCLAKDIRNGAKVKNLQVVDVTSLKFIPVREAHYVVGSRKRGTMSRVSKYAFKSLKDAKKFQSKYGGKIVDFHSAWQIAKKDFKK